MSKYNGSPEKAAEKLSRAADFLQGRTLSALSVAPAGLSFFLSQIQAQRRFAPAPGYLLPPRSRLSLGDPKKILRIDHKRPSDSARAS
jgi:hypothetical protein